MALLKIGDVEIKTPVTLKHEFFNLTKSGRTASGKMTMEIIAQKEKFTCEYDSMTSVDFNRMMSAAFDPTKPFYTLSVFEDNVWKDYTVYTGDVNKVLVRTGGIWYYKDVRIAFIEQ